MHQSRGLAIKLNRREFLVLSHLAMTINRAESQTVRFVGNRPSPCRFRLWPALLRVTFEIRIEVPLSASAHMRLFENVMISLVQS